MRRAANSYLEHEYEYQESLSAVGTTGKPPSARHWRADGAHRLFRFPGPPRCGSNAVHHARRTEQGQGAQEAATGMTACMRPRIKAEKPAAARAGRAEGAGDRGYLRRYVRSPPAGLKDSTVCPAFFIAPAINPRTVWFLCRHRHKAHYADVQIMPTCVGNPACGAGIAAMESA